MKSSDESSGYVDERVGPFEQPCKPEELTSSHQQMLEAISQILDRKLANLATKDDITALKDTIDQQRLKIEMLEAKVVMMEKYEQHIVVLEKAGASIAGKIDGDSLNGRIENLELRADENEQYHRRLCLRIFGVELDDGKEGESGQECFQKVQNILTEDLNLDISEMLIDRAHRIGPVVDDSDTGKRYRPIIIRFATWRHRTQVFKARKATKKYKIRPDLTHRRVKLLQKANGLLANSNDCFAFADINCRLCLKLKDKYRYFSTETQLLEYVKLI